ncbi:MAG: hypothetical protein ACU841_14635 [Gammaproteobacteria bacterium]
MKRIRSRQRHGTERRFVQCDVPMTGRNMNPGQQQPAVGGIIRQDSKAYGHQW